MKKGFTLVEVLVAVTIFMIAIASLAGFLNESIKGQRQILATQETIDNVSYVLEYMSRALRMAKKDDLGVGGVNCLLGSKVNYELTREGKGIKFRNYKDECQEFFLEGGRLKEWKMAGAEQSESYLTSENLEVSFLIGPADSWDQNDDLQATVTLFMEVKSKNNTGSDYPTLKVQTTISQRNLDVKQ